MTSGDRMAVGAESGGTVRGACAGQRPSDRGEVALPPLPALVAGRVVHRRYGAVRHQVDHRLDLWLVDLDDIPRFRPPLSWLASFRPEQHFPGRQGSARAAVDALLADHGLELGTDGRVVMLAGAAALGHLFDPLSVHWCLDGHGGLVAVIAEVRNTYAESHAYVLTPDRFGRAEADKAFYVSPFYEVRGTYALHFELSPERVCVTVRLHCDGDTAGRPDLVASFTGRPRPATSRAALHAVLRRPLMPHRVSALIRLHGLRLWTRLPIVPRATKENE